MQPNALNALAAALLLGTSYAAPTPDANKPIDNTDLLGQLITTPTQIQRFRKLLTDASGTKLLEGEDLIKATVWDFKQNGFDVPGSQGSSISGVSTPPITHLYIHLLTIQTGHPPRLPPPPQLRVEHQPRLHRPLRHPPPAHPPARLRILHHPVQQHHHDRHGL
jgi:hypothetical protein